MYDDPHETKFGEYLKNKREAAGLNKNELADKADVANTMVCFLENGRRPPGVSVFLRLVSALNFSLSETIEALTICVDEGYAYDQQNSFKAMLKLLNKFCDCSDLVLDEDVEAVLRNISNDQKEDT